MRTLCLLLLLGGGMYAQAQKLYRLSVENNQFVDPKGDPVVLRGVSTSDPDKLEKSGHWKKSYFQEIKAWGATVVRFPVHPSRWRARGEADYLRLLDQGIKWADELGLYVIIDWHSIGNLTAGQFFLDIYITDIEETFSFWETIAQRYGKNPTVAFYELYNEPTTNKEMLGTYTWGEWKVLNEDLIATVRTNGGMGIPLVAGFNWAYDLTEAYADPIAAEGIGYVSHPYPQKRETPWEEKWTADWGLIKEKYPLILTEIGFAGAEEDGAHVPVISDERYGEAITTYCDERDISYVVWVFDPDWDPGLFSDWKYTPTRQGTYFKEKFLEYK